jgi:hypothetical protein
VKTAQHAITGVPITAPVSGRTIAFAGRRSML